MLFDNDTKAAIRTLSNRSFKANIRQNKVMIGSIALVTFMMFTVFCVGISFYINYQKMNVRLTGTTADGILTDPTQDQLQTLRQLNLVSSIGEQIYAGSILPGRGESISLTFYDDTEWSNYIQGTVDQVVGAYPGTADEIMLSEDALKQLGISSPAIGMTVTADLTDGKTTRRESFLLSGWYRDYVGQKRPAGSVSANVAAAGLMGISAAANALVSESYAREHILYRTASFLMEKQGTEKMLRQALNLAEDQNIILLSSAKGTDTGSLYALAGSLSCGLFIMVCGYLLIYNIAYISIAKDIHFYGMLKTLGASPRQLKKIVRRQILLFSGIGIPFGLAAGTLLSGYAVPVILRTLLAGGGLGAMSDMVSFHPFLYLSAALFSFATVVSSCKKPAREAGRVSPIAAVRFTGIDAPSRKGFRPVRQSGNSLYRMALCNVFRDRKRAVLVFLSLFMGLTVFLAIYTIFSHPNWEYSAIVDAPFDFELSDTTLVNSLASGSAPLSPAFLESLQAVDGIAKQEIVYGCAVNLDVKNAVWAPYLENKLQVSSVEQESLYALPGADAAGISSGLLQSFPLAAGTAEGSALHDFEIGNTVYLSPTETGQVPPGITGQIISLQNPATGENVSYTIAGVLKELTAGEWKEGEHFYSGIGRIRDEQAVVSEHGRHRIAQIYMRPAGMIRLTPKPVINQIFLNAAFGLEASVKEQLTALLDKNPSISMLVQSDYIEINQMSLGAIMVIGTVFSLLLLLTGLINFANTMFTNVYARQKEFAALESIGMTKKQIRTSLTIEGTLYAAFSLLFLTVAGIPLTCGLVSLLRKEFYFLTFQPPVAAIAVIALSVGIICMTVPCRAYRQISQESLSSRLRTSAEF